MSENTKKDEYKYYVETVPPAATATASHMLAKSSDEVSHFRDFIHDPESDDRVCLRVRHSIAAPPPLDLLPWPL